MTYPFLLYLIIIKRVTKRGYSTQKEATKMAALSSKFAAISPGMETEQSTDGLVSMMKAFHIQTDDVEREIMDRVNRIGNTMATSNSEIVEMMKRSSAAMAAANNSIQETIALESAAVQITRNAETTGTAFRTISMRIRGYDEETEQLSDDLKNISGDIADLTKSAEHPNGISLFTDDTKQTYKSTYQILKDISKVYHELTDKQQAGLLEKLGGKRGAQSLAGLLEDFSEVEKAMDEMNASAGSSEKEMGIVKQSIEYHLNELKETWTGILQNTLKRGGLNEIIDLFTTLSKGVGLVTEKVGLLQTALAGLMTFAMKRKGLD